MLEIAIIICLAVILFLVLKNFPKTADFNAEENSLLELKKEVSNQEMKKPFFSKFFKQKSSLDKSDIIEEISKDNSKVIAPLEINEAQKAYKESDPEVAKILYEADLALEKGDLREAEEFALKAVVMDKKSSHAYVIIGQVAFSRGAFDDAKEAFKTALKCNPEAGEAYFGIGQIELRNENYSQALEALQKAVNMNRGIALWYAELGRAYMQVRQFSKATKALKRAASLDIDNKEYKELASEAEDKQRSHSAVYRYK